MLEDVVHLTSGLVPGFSWDFQLSSGLVLLLMAFCFRLYERSPDHYSLGSRISGNFVLCFKDTPMRTTSNVEHRDRRRKVASLHTLSAMVSYEDAIDRMTTLCMGKMNEFAKEKRLIAIPNFMQFSRTCIGRNITLLVMTKFLPQIVCRIDIKFEDGQKPWDLSCSFLVYSSYKCWAQLRENKDQK